MGLFTYDMDVDKLVGSPSLNTAFKRNIVGYIKDAVFRVPCLSDSKAVMVGVKSR